MLSFFYKEKTKAKLVLYGALDPNFLTGSVKFRKAAWLVSLEKCTIGLGNDTAKIAVLQRRRATSLMHFICNPIVVQPPFQVKIIRRRWFESHKGNEKLSLSSWIHREVIRIANTSIFITLYLSRLSS